MSHASAFLVAPRPTAAARRSPVATVAQYLQRRLQHSPYADLRSVRVSEQDGAIRLDGRVRTYYAKQLAQILVRDGNDDCRIDNAIDVA